MLTETSDIQLNCVYSNGQGVDKKSFESEEESSDGHSKASTDENDDKGSTTKSKSFCSKVFEPINAVERYCKDHSRIIKYIVLALLGAGYVSYFITACVMNINWAIALVVLTSLAVVSKVYDLVKKYKGEDIKRCFKPAHRCFKRNLRWIKWVFILVVLGLIMTWLAVDTSKRPEQLMSLGGICMFVPVLFLTSAHRTAVSWRPVFWGLGLQFAIGVFVIRTEPGLIAFKWLGDQVQIFLNYTKAGSEFVFGTELTQVFAFQTLPIVIFFSSVMSVLYYLGLMQWLIMKISSVMQVTMGTTATESLSVAGNIFIGQVEAPLLIRPYIKDMTQSEIHAVLTGGFATIAGGVMGAYISFGIDAAHLISASVMAAPCALATSKLSYPETEESKFKNGKNVKVDGGGQKNILEAASGGASASIGLVANIVANLIAFLAILAFVNAALDWFGVLVDYPGLTFQLICSYVFMPVAFMMGIPIEDAYVVAELLGTKLFLNEFIAYEKLSVLKNNRLNGLTAETISVRSEIICTYVLCGFANFSSVGMIIGALSSICPSRKNDISRLVMRALLTGTCVSLINACIAGILFVPPLDCVEYFKTSVFESTDPNIEHCCSDLLNSAVINGTVTFEGIWSQVTNATIYFKKCCSLYNGTIC
ncbi:sodium/nucleoside cotransporter 1-like isoform X1 [Alosa sapidissima]|uniref:sodium/nucleoside cotransporter 1-like isoform X1 n=2 Tax=Alosa sapidissima TaxID=34773 RepID=UPI001C091FE1|nr:sodium/nucleoside cotransporter 1-like isoform X1 [Alosa sapidissima]